MLDREQIFTSTLFVKLKDFLNPTTSECVNHRISALLKESD